MKQMIIFWLTTGILMLGCTKAYEKSAEQTADESPNKQEDVTMAKIETAGGLGLARIDINGFSELDLETKKSAYHYYRAAGIVEQSTLSAEEPAKRLMHKVFMGILEIENEIPNPLKDKVIPFVKRVLTEKKVNSTPSFIPGEFAAVTQIAASRGVDLGTEALRGIPLEATQLERLEALLAEIRPVIFGPRDLTLVDGGTENEVGEGKDAKSTFRSERLAQALTIPPSKDVTYIGWNGKTVLSPSQMTAMVLLPDRIINRFGEKLGLNPKAKQVLSLVGPSTQTISGHVILPGSTLDRSLQENQNSYFTNIPSAINQNIGNHLAHEFSPDDETRSRRIRCLNHVLRPYFLTDRTTAVPDGKIQTAFGGLIDVLIEVKYHLAALNLAFDDRVIKLQVLSEDCAMAVYDQFISASIEQWIWSDWTAPKEKNSRVARRLIFLRLLEQGVVERIQSNGNYFARVVNHSAMSAALKDLQNEVNRVIEERDIQGASTLLAGRNEVEDAAVLRNANNRYDQLGLPRRFAIIPPALAVKHDDKGRISDVTVRTSVSLLSHLKQTQSKFPGEHE